MWATVWILLCQLGVFAGSSSILTGAVPHHINGKIVRSTADVVAPRRSSGGTLGGPGPNAPNIVEWNSNPAVVSVWVRRDDEIVVAGIRVVKLEGI